MANLAADLTKRVLPRGHLALYLPRLARARRHEFHRSPPAVRHRFVVQIAEHAPAVFLLHGGLVPSPSRCAVEVRNVDYDGGRITG